MNKLKTFESFSNNLESVLIKIRNKYQMKYNKTPQQLNSGDCEDIAYVVIESLGGQTHMTFIMDDGWFWDIDTVSKYKTASHEYWNVKNLKKYGEPPFGYDKLDRLDLNGHVWVYSNGKHYDVECIEGVDNFWNLPIYIRQLGKLNLM